MGKDQIKTRKVQETEGDKVLEELREKESEKRKAEKRESVEQFLSIYRIIACP